MMKKSLIILFVCVWIAPFSFAQSSGNGGVANMVDASLQSLKESYQKLVDQNRLLISETQGHRERLRSLQEELDSLGSPENILSTNPGGQSQIETGSSEATYRQEIEYLEDQIDSISEKSLDREFQQKKSELDTALEHSKKKLHVARLDVNKVKDESTATAAAIAQLKVKQAQLQRQIAGKQTGQDLTSAKVYAGQLNGEIAALRSRQQALEKELSRSAKKDDIEIGGFTDESYLLRRRFVSLHDENMRLKRELFDLGTFGLFP